MLHAGSAATDITPPLGLDVAGNLWTGPSKGMADPLMCRALVLSDGSTRVALVSLDLLGLERPDALVAATLVEDRTGIPRHHVLISCSHTHFGPATYRRSSVCDWPAAYMEVLPYKVAETVAKATESVAPAEWGHRAGQDVESAFYRRLRWTDGRVRMPWPTLRPDTVASDESITDPTGSIDPTVDVLAFRRPGSDRPFTVLVTYAAHATSGPTQRWSASYPGRLAAALGRRLELGPESVLFMPGASGNIEPASDDMEQVGQSLAREAAEACGDIDWTRAERLRAAMRPLSLPARDLTGFPIEMVADVYQPWRDRDPLTFARVARYYANEYLRLVERGPAPHETVLQVIALGDVAIVAIPGEPFVELGREIKHSSPFDSTIVVSLANDTVGYIPDASSFEDGGYELIPAWQSRLAPEAGMLIVDAANQMLQDLADQ